MNSRRLGIYLTISALSLLGCSSSDNKGNDKKDSSEPPISDTSMISLDFNRIINTSGLDSFQVTINISQQDSTPKAISVSDVSVDRGEISNFTKLSAFQYRFQVTPPDTTPEATGEYPVTVSYEGESITRTPLVLSYVHEDWDQPMSVPGYANTAGYEDGITITPDGEYLFVQYGPLYFSGIILAGFPRNVGGCGGLRLTPTRCTHPWIDNSIGPLGAPERPGFFTGRFADDGSQLHNAVSWGIGNDEAVIFAPTTMFYGFKRQPDGSFKEPFYVSYDDLNDGIINPAGLSFIMHEKEEGKPQKATIAYFSNDADASGVVDHDNNLGTAAVDSHHDIYTTEITLGQNNILGEYRAADVAGQPPVRVQPFAPTMINFDKTGVKGISGTQGNPHLYHENRVVKSVWTDDEFDEVGSSDPAKADLDNDKGDIAVYVLTSGVFPNGTWEKVIVPVAVENNDGSHEIQPFFTGNRLFFTQSTSSKNPEVFYSDYLPTDSTSVNDTAELAKAGNWSAPSKVLGINVSNSLHSVVAIGEPTIANYKNDEYLYFVYGVVREELDNSNQKPLPDINMQAGFIRKK